MHRMAARLRSAFAAAVVLALALAAQTADSSAAERGRTGAFLILSDIHFDPFAVPGIAAKLADAPLEDWSGILRRSGGAFPKFGSDSNHPLLDSALRAAASLGERYDLVLVSGDLLAHDFGRNAVTALGGAAAARAFATKTSRYVARAVQEQFAGIPVVPAIGNDDGDCGDYGVEPDGTYLKQMSAAWTVFETNQAARDSFASSGSFSLPHPLVPKHRLIVLNDVYLSREYRDTCRPADADPGRQALRWLEGQLAEAARDGATATLLMHIPPGFDGYASATGGPSCSGAVPLWRADYAEEFRTLAQRYRTVLVNGITGHLHTDGFRLFGAGGGDPFLPIHIVPSISPVFYNNPAFTVFRYDRRTAANRNVSVYFTQLNAAKPDRMWRREYRFDQAYRLPDLAAATLRTLSRRIEPGKPLFSAFKANFQVHAGQTIADAAWRSYLCAQTFDDEASFVACRCGG